MQETRDFVQQYKRPVVNVDEVAPVVRRFLDALNDKFLQHPLWRVSEGWAGHIPTITTQPVFPPSPHQH